MSLRRFRVALLVTLPLLAGMARADVTLAPVDVTEWKAVYGQIESRDRIPARARLGGTLVSLTVAEGDSVTAGQKLAEVVDAKLAFQLGANDARMASLQAQLDNAQTELKRGEDLLARGVSTAQRLDALRTQVDVLSGQIEAVRAERQVIEQQAAEGAVLAPVAGRVLTVPVAAGAVVMPGEEVASVGGGGTYLRLAVPERNAAMLHEGDAIVIEHPEGTAEGKLARVYPLIENGRVIADVEVAELPDRFLNIRVLVRLPVGKRQALMVPSGAIQSRDGLDFVSVRSGEAVVLRTVVPGQSQTLDGAAMTEILSGLQAGDQVVTPHE